MRLHDTLLGALLVALASAFFAYTFTFPDMPGQRYGPALFPRLIALGIIACGLVIAVRGRRSAGSWLAFSEPLVGGLCAWLGVRLWAALLTGVLAALVVQWFFGSLMRVPLPRGWFMQLVAGG